MTDPTLGLSEEEVRLVDRWYAELKDHQGPWAPFPNPMRSDGVFVFQDRPIRPRSYLDPQAGSPAVPAGAAGVPHQLSHHVADALVARLNAKDG